MADDFISQLMASGLLGGGNSIQGGLLGQLGNATQPYGGMGNLGLSLLANSGPTPYKRGFGQVFGQSALQSQDTANKNAEQKLQLMTGAMGLQQAMQRQKEYSDYVASMNGQQVPQGQPQGQPPDQSQSPDANLPPPMIRAPGFQGYDPSNPSQPPQQAQQAPQPQSAAPPPGVSGLATPDQVNAAARYAMSQPNANPLEIQKARDAQLLAIAQRGAQSQIAPLEEVVKSPDSAKMVSANPQLQQVWRQIAPGLGMDPVKDFNDNNVRVAFTMAGNQIRTQSQLPTQAPPAALRTVKLPDGRTAQIDPMTGKQTIEAASDLEKVIGPNGQPILVPKGQAAGMTPFNQSIFGAANLDDQTKEMAFQFAKANGGKLPPFMNSRGDAAKGALANYIAKRAAQEGDTATSMVAQGQATQAAGNVLKDFTSGPTNKKIVAINTGVAHLDALNPLIDAMDTGNVTIINKARQLFQKQTGKPAPTNYQTLANMAVGEVSQAVTAGGGTGPERDHLAAPFESANGKDVLHGAVQQAITALAGKTDALRTSWDSGTNGTHGSFDKYLGPATKKALGITTTADAGAHPADIQDLLSKYGH